MSFATATPLALGTPSYGIIERLTDADYFSFAADGAGSYQIDVSPDSPSMLDAKLVVYDSNGRFVTSVDDPNGITANVTLDLSPGTYYAVVESHGNYADIGPYGITVQAVASPSPPAPNTSGLTSPANLAASLGSGDNVNLAWDSTSGASQYVVERSWDGVNFTPVGTITATNYTDVDPGGSQYWFYRVDASDGTNQSDPSDPVHIINRPAAAANVQVDSINTATLVLDWDDTPVVDETGYRVERSTDDATWTTLATLPANSVSYTDSSLAAGTLYYYRLTPTSDLGDGAAAVASGSTWVAAPTGLHFAMRRCGEMTIAWSNVNGAASYQVERSTNGSAYTTVASMPAGTTSYTDASVTPLQEYWYRVVGVGANGAAVASSSVFALDPADETGMGPMVTTPLPDVSLAPGDYDFVNLGDSFSYSGVTATHYTVSEDTNPALFSVPPVIYVGMTSTSLFFTADQNSLGGSADITIDYTAETGVCAQSTFTVTVSSSLKITQGSGSLGSGDDTSDDPGSINIESGIFTVTTAGAISGYTNLSIADGASCVLDVGAGGPSVMEGGTLQLGDGTLDGTLQSDILLANGPGASESAVLDFNNPDDEDFANSIAGDGSVIQDGADTLTLSGPNNTYSGPTTIDTGTVAAGSTTGLSHNSVITVDQGATLDLAGNDSRIASLAGSGTVTTSTGPATLAVGSDGGDSQFDGVLQDGSPDAPLALTKAGIGTFTLTGTASNYSGGTDIEAGTLKVASATALGNTNGSLTVNDGGLDLNDQSITVGGV